MNEMKFTIEEFKEKAAKFLDWINDSSNSYREVLRRVRVIGDAYTDEFEYERREARSWRDALFEVEWWFEEIFVMEQTMEKMGEKELTKEEFEEKSDKFERRLENLSNKYSDELDKLHEYECTFAIFDKILGKGDDCIDHIRDYRENLDSMSGQIYGWTNAISEAREMFHKIFDGALN